MKTHRRCLYSLGFLAASLCAVGCSAEAEDTDADEAEVKADETEVRVVQTAVQSTEPRATGVEQWRISLAMSASRGPFWLATGLGPGCATLERESMRCVGEATVEVALYGEQKEAKMEVRTVKGEPLALEQIRKFAPDFKLIARQFQKNGDAKLAPVVAPGPGPVEAAAEVVRSCVYRTGVVLFDAAALLLETAYGVSVCAATAVGVVTVVPVLLGVDGKECVHEANFLPDHIEKVSKTRWEDAYRTCTNTWGK